jgi:hypothetical protein
MQSFGAPAPENLHKAAKLAISASAGNQSYLHTI